MVPLAESSVTPDEATGCEVDAGRAIGPDPLRRAVHVALALYLTPLVLVVCLIGGASIMFGKASKVAGRLASRPPRRGKDGHLLLARPGDEEIGPHFQDGRERAHVGH